jgi:hypothetical protein
VAQVANRNAVVPLQPPALLKQAQVPEQLLQLHPRQHQLALVLDQDSTIDVIETALSL